MSLNATMAALQTALAGVFPAMTVTRSYRPMAQINRAELLAGVLTLVARGEQDYANYVGREAQLGIMPVLLLVQFELAGNPAGKPDGVAVEQREFEIAEQIKTWLGGALPAGVASCLASGFAQSSQLEVPRGWVVFELEVRSG